MRPLTPGETLVVLLGYDLIEFIDAVPDEPTESLIEALALIPEQTFKPEKAERMEADRKIALEVLRGQLQSRGVAIPEGT